MCIRDRLIELETPEGFTLSAPATELDLVALTPPDEVYQIALTSKADIQAAQYRLEEMCIRDRYYVGRR